jgi:hypothetical protein
MEFDGYYMNEEPLQSFFVDYADNAPLVPYDGTENSTRTICPLNTGGDDETKDLYIRQEISGKDYPEAKAHA